MAFDRNRGRGFRNGGGSSGGGFRRFPREMHKITCSECGKEAEVPFRPREGTPVYCKDCFLKKKGITPRTEEKERPEQESEEAEGAEEAEEVEEDTEDEE